MRGLSLADVAALLGFSYESDEGPALSSAQEPDDAGADEVRLVDAHDVTRVG